MCQETVTETRALRSFSFSDKLLAILAQMTMAEEERYAKSLAVASVCMKLYRYAACDPLLNNLRNMETYYVAARKLTAALQADTLPIGFAMMDERMKIAAYTTIVHDYDFRQEHIHEAIQLIADIRTFAIKVGQLTCQLIQTTWQQQPPMGPFEDQMSWHRPLSELVHELRASDRVTDWREIPILLSDFSWELTLSS